MWSHELQASVQGSLTLPGPAVTAATPTTPDSLATASAANTAVT